MNTNMLLYLLDAPPDAKLIEAPPGTYTYYFSVLDNWDAAPHTERMELTQYGKFAAGYSLVGNIVVFSRNA